MRDWLLVGWVDEWMDVREMKSLEVRRDIKR